MTKAHFDKELFCITGDVLELRLIDTYEGKDENLPFYWWNIILRSTDIVIGKISFRIGHNFHSYYNGNIGYEIDETYRGHHYAQQACRLALKAARSHKMEKIYLTCDYDNIASYKTIERLGAVLVEETVPPESYIYYYEGIPKHRIYELCLTDN